MKAKIPEGYKLTEVGVIPDNWKAEKLGELFKFKNGLNAEKKHYGKGIKFINILEVIQKISLLYEDIPGLISLEPGTIKSNIVQKGDVLFNRTSETQEEIGLTSVYLDDKEVVFGGFVIRARPITDSIDHYFSKYGFSSVIVRNQIIKRGQGAVRANIGQSDLKEVCIPLPPLPEQKAIAQSLSDVDALITECDRIIAKKRNTKQGTMQQLLTGKKRLPGFSGKWEMEEFEQVLKVVDGDRGDNYPSNDELFGNGYCLFLSARNVTKEGFKFSECIFITKEKDNLLGKGKLLKKDVVLTTRGTVGNIAFFDNSVPFENIRINSGMVILRTEEKNLDNTYLYSFLRSHLFQNQIDRAVFGSAQPQLTVKGISKFKIPVSPLAEQKAIAQVLSDMDTEIAALEQKRDKYKAIKQGMMQELLTGKTRLIGSY
ncbi:restriction endonuclease subunit S [Nostoc sp.]|uniref:restriction endonuclease subunit S n=1 Tax=Nostoc sp. TaxID=1180 RepID=UPI002FF7901A